MAEEVVKSVKEEESNEDSCPVCLLKIIHKATLPCSHAFCYLCAKGAITRNQRCPLCRSIVSMSYINAMNLNNSNLSIATFEDNYHWYYQGQNGWWLYDTRISQLIEDSFKAEKPFCEVMISGFIYVIDFVDMTQYRKDRPDRKRKIKRDQVEENTKGIAGLRGNINFI